MIFLMEPLAQARKPSRREFGSLPEGHTAKWGSCELRQAIQARPLNL